MLSEMESEMEGEEYESENGMNTQLLAELHLLSIRASQKKIVEREIDALQRQLRERETELEGKERVIVS